MKEIRCIIYTRKSSEEGLDQDFNSLHAQREACSAYIASQASEGWLLLPERYDDGGLSGGTLERPALQRLLSDIATREIDIIVVYKVDRLTRSLLDFAKLVEAFDKAGTSFVSVTQAFNTTTSMGRLTLNMLLSFAQFEREVTTERIRDKIAASKAKGMWMGGTPPLGYRPDGRSLAIVHEHAAIVREVYARYLTIGNVRHLAEQLQADRIGAPVRHSGKGSPFGGRPFTRGQLYAILKNPVYLGRIAHKGRTFEGRHPGIIAPVQWDAVQKKLAENVRGQRQGRRPQEGLLVGKLFEAGKPLVATYTNKGTVRYRYYVSRTKHFDASPEGMRIPAGEIEGVVVDLVAGLFGDAVGLLDKLGAQLDSSNIASVMSTCAELSVTLKGTRRSEVRSVLDCVQIESGRIRIDLSLPELLRLLDLTGASQKAACFSVMVPVHLTRTGRVVRLVDRTGIVAAARAPDLALVALLAKARRWWGRLADGELNVQSLAAEEGVSPSWMIRVVRLAFLSPSVVEAALEGTLRAEINGTMLVQKDAVSASWAEQETRLLAFT
ncbi:recombinase family protein [Novosphingobium ginsenosidimutans]|uniref:Recombinase family protein n=1 Tax=Novosphingobium ginsenosidimutans TaxID=1176536 RepID=A0A5B8S2S6_9SPHN|nr:recombinase family protein [Novosphingobium ginsenosidimutans]QEA15613.1 recombinase family protein [Novosphingobium ginsenosidimutans]